MAKRGAGGVRYELPDGTAQTLSDCPLNVVTERDWELVRRFGYWRAGIRDWLPGGIGDIPSRDLEAMEVLADQHERCERETRQPRGEVSDGG